jgi:hypothetical protein
MPNSLILLYPTPRRMVVGMAVRGYDLVFVGGDLAALPLLRELGPALPDRVAVVDPCLPHEHPTVHGSYWSCKETPYDRFAFGVWRKARVAGKPPEPIAPFALRLVRSADVLAHLDRIPGSPPSGGFRQEHARSPAWPTGATRSSRTRERCGRNGCSTVSPTFPYVSFSTTAARPGKRHGHPRRGRRAGLRSEYRHPLRSAGLEFLCLPASAEPHGGAARIRLFRTRRNERGSDIPTWVPPDAPPGAGFTVSYAESGCIPLGFAPHEPRAHDTYCSA